MRKSSHPMSDKLAVIMDIGGTNSRVIVVKPGNGTEKHETVLKKVGNVSSKSKLNSFINDIKEKVDFDTIGTAIISIAGPVKEHKEVVVTNWEGSPLISLKDFIDSGLPVNRTIMLNDMEAAAFGIIALANRKRIPSDECICLFEPESFLVDPNQPSNKILLMPGTGLGTVSIVTFKTEQNLRLMKPMASEVQHSCVSSVGENHDHLISLFRKEKGLEYLPSWEDFVSGPGLADVYDYLSKHVYPDKNKIALDEVEDAASVIAKNAVDGKDSICRESLDIYYRCTGRLAQMMALSVLPFGGIFLAGATTIKNLDFIRQSGFMAEIHASNRERDLLRNFPVYLVTQKDLNIEGGLFLCLSADLDLYI